MLGVCNQVSLGSGQRPGYVVTIEGTDTHQAPEYPSVICTSVCVSTLQNPPHAEAHGGGWGPSVSAYVPSQNGLGPICVLTDKTAGFLLSQGCVLENEGLFTFMCVSEGLATFQGGHLCSVLSGGLLHPALDVPTQ